MQIAVTVNGTRHEADVEPRTLLVYFVRDSLGLTGTNVGCDTSTCGSCTVLVDGQSVKSCTMLAVQADGREITTIEGMASDGEMHPLQEAFHEHHGLQCGYCTPGMIMAADSLIREATARSPRRTSASASKGTSAAARATTTSSRPSWPHRRRCRPAPRHKEGAMAQTAERFVGSPVLRKEDPELVTGQARFVDDMTLPGMVWMRSCEARTRTRTSAASTPPRRKRCPAWSACTRRPTWRATSPGPCRSCGRSPRTSRSPRTGR